MTDELTYVSRPKLERPVLIAAFRGWNDGGQGASLAGAYLARAWAAIEFASILLYDAFVDALAVLVLYEEVDSVVDRLAWCLFDLRRARSA